MLPKDSHSCEYTLISSTLPSSELIFTQSLSEAITNSKLSLQNSNLFNNVFDISIPTYTISSIDDHSCVFVAINMDRWQGFFLQYYLIPSVLFVAIAYSSFWIDK